MVSVIKSSWLAKGGFCWLLPKWVGRDQVTAEPLFQTRKGLHLRFIPDPTPGKPQSMCFADWPGGDVEVPEDSEVGQCPGRGSGQGKDRND